MPSRPFRCTVQGRGLPTRDELTAKVRRVEALGFDGFVVADHFGGGLGAVAALTAAAMVTERLRLGTYVVANDFRHPVNLAKEAATIDHLANGRFELGIGAGWMRSEYEAAGMPFDPAPVRIARLEESLQLLKRLFADEPATFTGEHYQVRDLDVQPKPLQRPHPPLLVGGGGQRVLEVAARHADIVGFGPQSRRDGTLDPASCTAAATARKVAWVRDAAGSRLPDLDLNIFVYAVEVSDNRQAVADRLAPDFELPAAELLTSPHLLIGSVDSIIEDLHARREQYGIASITITEDLMEPLAPIVARLSGRCPETRVSSDPRPRKEPPCASG